MFIFDTLLVSFFNTPISITLYGVIKVIFIRHI